MKYVDEFRDHVVAAALAERIKKAVRRPWTIMEVCGGQTHAIVLFGLDSLLSQDLTLVRHEREPNDSGGRRAIALVLTKVCARACIVG